MKMRPHPVAFASFGALASCVLATLGCAGSTPDIEYPVGEIHHETPQFVPSETDIFSEQYSDVDPSALDQFRTELESHGTWVDDPRLGTVWFPARAEVGQNFTPYATHGRWTYGQSEYVWVSTLPWGWATFHYGRWMFSGSRGWAWVPGRRYAGAWVVWRTGPSGYVGWGPAPANWYWQNEVPVRTPKPTTLGFVYCKASDLFATSVANKLIGLPDVVRIATETKPYAWQEKSTALAPMSNAPPPAELGISPESVAVTPSDDPTLQRAWLIARPGGARAAGVRPLLGSEPPRLKEWVIGRPRYIQSSASDGK